MKRWLLCTALLITSFVVTAQETSQLPDMGSSAGELLTPAQERLYGGMMLRQLRGYGMLIDDPLLEGYIQSLGYQLSSRSDRPRETFTFFLMRSRQINAFATLGGYVGVNAGLILTADREDELAAVLSHEIAHVTQRHVLRAVEQAKRDQIPIMLGTLAAIIAASQSGSADGVQAAAVGGMSLMQQRQIDYTRSNEHEADRLGIQTLSRAGYEPVAMADFFARMERQMRGNLGGAQAPEYLRSHPVTTTRISEAKSRAEQLKNRENCLYGKPDDVLSPLARPGCAPIPLTARNPNNPLLPDSISSVLDAGLPSRELFDLARERLRVLSADNPNQSVTEYQQLRRAAENTFSPAQRYGLALAQSLNGQTQAAGQELQALAAHYPTLYWIALALAENDHRAGLRASSRQRYDALLETYPQNAAISLSYANSLAEYGETEAAQTAQELLRPLMTSHGDDPAFQRIFARASEVAGDTVRAAEAWAEVAWLNGRPDDALSQLERLRKEKELDFYQRSRVDARIAAMTPVALEFRRQHGLGSGSRFDAHTPGFHP